MGGQALFPRSSLPPVSMEAFNLGNSSARDLNRVLLDSFAMNGDGSQPIRLKLSEDMNLASRYFY